MGRNNQRFLPIIKMYMETKILKNTTFSNNTQFESIKEEFNNVNVVLRRCTFEEQLKLNKLNCRGYLLFQNCAFDSGVQIFGSDFSKHVEFIDCTFSYMEVSDSKLKDRFTLTNCTIKNHFEIIDSEFYGICRWHKNNFLCGCNLFQTEENQRSFGKVKFHGVLKFY